MMTPPKVHPFYSMKQIEGDTSFDRTNGNKTLPGIYFWGFNLSKNNELPQKDSELVIYYIGKSTRNVVERMMQEITQLIFGGFGTIISKDWLSAHPFSANITFLKNHSNHNAVLYNPKGLHDLYAFLTTKGTDLEETLTWMKERLIFTWIEGIELNQLTQFESEIHKLVCTNVLGIGQRVSFKDVKRFKDSIIYSTEINWSENMELRNWLIQVNNNLRKLKKNVPGGKSKIAEKIRQVMSNTDLIKGWMEEKYIPDPTIVSNPVIADLIEPN